MIYLLWALIALLSIGSFLLIASCCVLFVALCFGTKKPKNAILYNATVSPCSYANALRKKYNINKSQAFKLAHIASRRSKNSSLSV